MTLLACIASAIVSLMTGVTATVLIHRTEAARIMHARIELARQWRLLSGLWQRMDPATRPKVYQHLSFQQRLVFFSEIAKHDMKGESHVTQAEAQA